MTKWITAMMVGVAQLPIAAYAQTAPSSDNGDSPAPSADIIVTALNRPGIAGGPNS